MNIFKYLMSSCVSFYYFVREKCNPPTIREGKDIPIIINNFNRFATLLNLIEALQSRGYDNIYIIDNASTYPPLLDYYKQCPYKVFRLKENLGFKALWKSGLNKRLCKDFFVYTDSDVVPAPYCPDNFLDYFLVQLKKHPFARKIGFSLRIDNLPDCYAYKKEVIQAEKKYYMHLKDGLYRAPIDTTFALYRPGIGLSRSRSVEAYRTAYPYQAEHLPWYADSSNLSEEEQYYISHCRHVTSWTSKAKQ